MDKVPNVVPASVQSPPSIPYQMNMTFDAIELRGMSAAQRTRAISQLASLLMQAAGIVTAKGRGDDEC